MTPDVKDGLHRPEWSGRTVLITGGTSGTGYRAAQRLVDLGANVVINGRHRGRSEAAAESLEARGGRVDVAVADCADYDQALGAVDATVRRFGGLDVLISAGAKGEGGPKPFAQMTPEEVVEGFESRYTARLFPVHAALRHLGGRPDANVVMLTTDAGRHATVGESVIGAYAASIIQLTKTLARELARDRVRVNAVSMTLTSGTQSWDHIFDEASFQRDLFAKAVSRFPFGGAPTADDVAEAVVYLASPSASQITGQTISVNGGLSFGGW